MGVRVLAPNIALVVYLCDIATLPMSGGMGEYRGFIIGELLEMHMKKLMFWVLTSVLVLSGCSTLPPQKNVQIDPLLWAEKQKIGVYVSPASKITTSFPGAGCLLCLGAASLANGSLTKQVETFQADELAKTKDRIIALLEKKGVEVVVIDKLIPDSKLPKIKATENSTLRRHYGPYKKQYGIDQLLVVDYHAGVIRNYSSYIPIGAPLAIVSGQFFMINLDTNNYTLFNPLNISKSVEGEWSSPPTFPGVTNAFYQAEEAAVDQIIASFN